MSDDHIKQTAIENAEFLSNNRATIGQLLERKLTGAEREVVEAATEGRLDRGRLREIARNHNINL